MVQSLRRSSELTCCCCGTCSRTRCSPSAQQRRRLPTLSSSTTPSLSYKKNSLSVFSSKNANIHASALTLSSPNFSTSSSIFAASSTIFSSISSRVGSFPFFAPSTGALYDSSAVVIK